MIDRFNRGEAGAPGGQDADALLAALEPGPPAEPTGRYAVATIPLHGGRLCLDFTYTAVWRATPRPHETLIDYTALLGFARRVGTIEAWEAERLGAAAAFRPAEAAQVVERAIALREAIYRIFVAHIAGRPPRSGDLARFNGELSESMASAAVRPVDRRFVWDWTDPSGDRPEKLTQPLWPISRSAAELLTSRELDRVKRCPGDGCGWLFLDTSKNASRRWCDMAGCGNRARVRAFAARKRAARQAAADR